MCDCVCRGVWGGLDVRVMVTVLVKGKECASSQAPWVVRSAPYGTRAPNTCRGHGRGERARTEAAEAQEDGKTQAEGEVCGGEEPKEKCNRSLLETSLGCERHERPPKLRGRHTASSPLLAAAFLFAFFS